MTRHTGVLIVAVALVIVLWWSVGVLLPGSWLVSSSEERARFGDAFGAVNALFSGLAFAGLIWAILLQRQELEYQREELISTRGELAAQRAQMEVQNETLRRQSFENTFFQLVRLHHEIASSIEVRDGAATLRGPDAFEFLYGQFRIELGQRAGRDGTVNERLADGYRRFYSAHQNALGHYFRNLYNIIKFVDRSRVADKRLYTNLVRAQVSAAELLLLFYNCLSDLGSEKFKPLVERYGLLKTVPRERLVEAANAELYEAAAFAGSDV